MLDLTLESEIRSTDAVIISVAGELDMYTAPAFELELASALAGSPRRVIVDLSECEFLDSSALAGLLRAREACQDKTRISLAGVDQNILKVFQITGLDKVFMIERAVPPMPRLRAVSEDQDRGEANVRLLFRMVNEQILTLSEIFDSDGKRSYICECPDIDCTQGVLVTRAEFASTRERVCCFLIASSHARAELETVVFENDRFSLISTLDSEPFRIAGSEACTTPPVEARPGTTGPAAA